VTELTIIIAPIWYRQAIISVFAPTCLVKTGESRSQGWSPQKLFIILRHSAERWNKAAYDQLRADEFYELSTNPFNPQIVNGTLIIEHYLPVPIEPLTPRELGQGAADQSLMDEMLEIRNVRVKARTKEVVQLQTKVQQMFGIMWNHMNADSKDKVMNEPSSSAAELSGDSLTLYKLIR
jgi:hypothetical protein